MMRETETAICNDVKTTLNERKNMIEGRNVTKLKLQVLLTNAQEQTNQDRRSNEYVHIFLTDKCISR